MTQQGLWKITIILLSTTFWSLQSPIQFEIKTLQQLDLTSLIFIDMSHSNLSRAGLGIHKYPHLETAILSHNSIACLESNEFINNKNIKHLDLSYNKLKYIYRDNFKGLTLLIYLDLSWNYIAALPDDSLLHMKSLTHLKLTNNYLTNVGIITSKSLTVLDLSSCAITSISKNSLKEMTSLTSLNLSRNILESIPDRISSRSLQHLNLDHNALRSVNNDTFVMLPNLRSLCVTGNQFKTPWAIWFFNENHYLERVKLSNNIWECKCTDKMADFYGFLLSKNKEESQNLMCHSPADVIGQTWSDACDLSNWNLKYNILQMQLYPVELYGLIMLALVLVIIIGIYSILSSSVVSQRNRPLLYTH